MGGLHVLVFPEIYTRARYLVAGPAFQTVGVELVDVEDVDGALDAEVVQLAAHLEVQQVVLCMEQSGTQSNDEGMRCFFYPGATF